METFSVTFSFKGKTATVPQISRGTPQTALLSLARQHLAVDDDTLLKLLHKGKIIAQDAASDGSEEPAFSHDVQIPNNTAKVIVMGTAAKGIEVLNSQRSDPLMRGFDEEEALKTKTTTTTSYWGIHGKQHKEYKFCRLQECTDASFGTRPGASTPHAFEARRLLEQLASDPGIVAILTSRELVVGTLGEMDPIDDRLMQKKQQEGACLLGYNTNHGMRIDVKLRTDDLSSFRPYSELASTLIHELSHNWVGEHNALFWTNYANMRCEYLWKHAMLMSGGDFVNGKRTAELAGVVHMIQDTQTKIKAGTLTKTQLMENIYQSVIEETAREMTQHRIPVQMISDSVLEFTKDLMEETQLDNANGGGGQKLGGSTETASVRELALAAAERRAREETKKQNDDAKR